MSDTASILAFVNSQFALNPPIFRGVQLVAQSLTSSSLTPITFTSSIYDTYTGHSNSTNPSRYTAAVAGYYTVSGVAAFAASSAGSRQSVVAVNGSAVNATSGFVASPSSSDPVAVPSPTFDLFLNVGDYVELWAAQDSGASLNTNVSNGIVSSLWVRYSHQ